MVATNVGGIPEIVDENCGILVENENSDEFAKALVSLIDDENKRKILGQLGKEKIQNVFDDQKIILKLDKIYVDMMKG